MNWYGPQIVPHSTYDEFRNYVLGKGFDMDGFYGPQCWDGADLIWYQYGLYLYTGPQGYAYECWAVSRSLNAVLPFTDIYGGIQTIKKGDIVVFGPTQDNPAGHIGYADEDYNGGSYFNLLGQNQGPGSGISGLPFNIYPIAYSQVIGAFVNTYWQGTPPPTPTARTKFPWVLFARKFRNGLR